ncbi:MAG: type II secretion system F family protein [Acidimicrobiia bacterium]|nr:type II secretion system F family protein [Acidimicrobiia bacterium]
MLALLPLLAFAFGTLGLAGAAWWLLSRRAVAVDRRIREVVEREPEADPERAQQVAEFFGRVGRRAPKSPKELSKLSLRLVRAGFRRPDALAIFIGMRLTVALAAFLLLVTPILMRPNVALALVALGFGYILPGIVLARLAGRRQKRIQLALADTLDLLVVSVEAGLGLDQALARVGDELQHTYPDLSGELRLVNLELLAGTARSDALRNLADRTGVDDLNSLVTMLIQTDKFGTSVAQSLRVFSETLRTRRRQRAEEAAAKTGVKMVFPLVVCIFPAVWVVAIGPAAIKFVRVLGPLVSGLE